MVKKHLLFLGFQAKTTIRILPLLLLCTLIFGCLSGALAYAGGKLLDSGDKGPMQIKVAAVVPENDPLVKLGLDTVKHMDSLKNICQIVTTDKSSALRMLQNNEVALALLLPPGFVDGIMDGTNLPATVYLPENSGLETMLFCSVIDAGSNTLAYVQSGIYAVDDLLRAHGKDSYVADAESWLNDFYMQYALNRNTFFQAEAVSSTGDVSMAGFFISSGVLLVMLLCGMSVTEVFASRKNSLMESLRIHGISPAFLRFGEFLSVTLLFFVLFQGMALLAGVTIDPDFIPDSISEVLAFLLLCGGISAFLMFLSCLGDSPMIHIVLLFLLSAVMLYAAGRIIPAAFLPSGVEAAGSRTPAAYWGHLLESIFYGKLQAVDLCMTSFYGVLFFCLSIVITVAKRRKNA